VAVPKAGWERLAISEIVQTTTATALEKTRCVYMKILEKEQTGLFLDADAKKDSLEIRNMKSVET
jgi:hypothetical protein